MTSPFDFEKALQDLQSGQELTGKNGILTPLIKQLTEAALKAELEQYLASEQQPNRKNGRSQKTIKALTGSFELETPRDRSGTFEPQLIKKNQSQISDEIEQKILSMFGLGMGYQDIRQHVAEMYGLDISNGTVSAVTDSLLPQLELWQQRPLQSHYPIVWLDAVHYKVRVDGRYISQAIYTILALDVEGKKEILGLYLSENEGANH